MVAVIKKLMAGVWGGGGVVYNLLKNIPKKINNTLIVISTEYDGSTWVPEPSW